MRLLTAREVAELLQVPPSWVYAAARSGAIPVIQLGRYKRFSRDEIERWLDSGANASVTSVGSGKRP